MIIAANTGFAAFIRLSAGIIGTFISKQQARKYLFGK